MEQKQIITLPFPPTRELEITSQFEIRVNIQKPPEIHPSIIIHEKKQKKTNNKKKVNIRKKNRENAIKKQRLE